MIPLRKLGPGEYETLDGRYRIEHQDGETECEHPLCFDLHRKWHTRSGNGWRHLTTYVSWHIWDTKTDDYFGGFGPDEYDTMRAARSALTHALAEEATS